MPVWCQTIPGCRSAVAMLVVKVGARYESPDRAGISHLIEHLLFAGSLR